MFPPISIQNCGKLRYANEKRQTAYQREKFLQKHVLEFLVTISTPMEATRRIKSHCPTPDKNFRNTLYQIKRPNTGIHASSTCCKQTSKNANLNTSFISYYYPCFFLLLLFFNTPPPPLFHYRLLRIAPFHPILVGYDIIRSHCCTWHYTVPYYRAYTPMYSRKRALHLTSPLLLRSLCFFSPSIRYAR